MKDRIAIRKLNSDNYAVIDTVAPQIIISKADEINVAIGQIKNDWVPLATIKKMYKANQGILTNIYILLTDTCNLTCDYCFEKAYITGGNMGRNVADTSIKRIGEYLKQFNGELIITFYGGEPLINIDIAIYIMDGLSVYDNVRFQLITNGTLITESIATKLKCHPVLIGVSVDGCEKVHNFHRKYANGENTYSDVVKAIKLLADYDYKVGISITLTMEMICNNGSFINWLKSIPIESISFNLLRCTFKTFEEAEQYYKKAAEFMFEIYLTAREYALYEYNIFKRLKCLYEGGLLFSECAASSGNQITIDTNGNIYTCQICREPQSLLGHIENFDFSKIPSISMGKSIPLFCDYCEGCYAMPVCGGGCPVQDKNMLYKNGILDNQIDYSNCAFAKTLMDLVLFKIDNELFEK